MSNVWDPERVASWLRRAEGLERQLAPVSAVLFAAADLQPGERVLDVGCGSGPTTREAAAVVGTSGRVTGIDVSADMIEAARAASSPSIEWIVADVATWEPPPTVWNVVISRFGVMFFDDPPAALLVGAGWAAPTTVTHDLELVVEGGSTVEEAAAGFLDVGPTRIVSEGGDDATRAAVVAAIADALRAHVDENGRVVLGGRVLVTTARR